MSQYVAPLRDMQFVLHELLQVENELEQLPKHAEIDADTINQVLEEGGKFTSKVLFPLFIVRKVAVLGAGVMGAQIATHCINARVPVVLFDLPPIAGRFLRVAKGK
ncbi:MAG: acyl-CoA dehydrogenase N-terminal domain-containing protein [Betaproteobacteria bacterium]|nr:acyl-CoA dehydrogenase N-terminal domain-containing protein [Betaproteobacteria bacterium]